MCGVFPLIDSGEAKRFQTGVNVILHLKQKSLIPRSPLTARPCCSSFAVYMRLTFSILQHNRQCVIIFC